MKSNWSWWVCKLLFAAALLSGCGEPPWNNPYPKADSAQNILYSSFDARPKHLDPVQSYSSNEYRIIGPIYEPPLQYHYLKRPYVLEPLTAEKLPEPTYLDAAGNRLSADAPHERIAFSVYEVEIKRGIRFQPHPAFAKDEEDNHRYLALTPTDLKTIDELSDFEHTGTRELVAADYIYQIKRLAHPRLHSPIFSVMSEYIVGLAEYAETLRIADAALVTKSGDEAYLDLARYPLSGVQKVDRYTYRIKVKGKYPQLLYWLAMPFFAPIPPEADRFYSQPGMKQRNLTFDWYPVGTGAYMLTINNPNRQMVLEHNPNFHPDYYPSEAAPGDEATGLLVAAGKRLPFIDKVVYSLEKETIPYWNKFLQGYYDVSGITSDSFDQAIQFDVRGDTELSPSMRAKGIRLITSVQTSSFYLGFNVLDSVVGGDTEPARMLRRAISIAIDYEDLISIFRNGRGIAAQGPIPPGIFGHVDGASGINPYVYDWIDGAPRRKPVAEAKRLLAEAGYPNGRDARTGKPLLLHLDVTATGPEDKAFLDWFRKQFRKIDLELIIRNTDYNRFQEKMRKGNAQLFMWGWNADYPDPENFFFLLYGPNSKVNYHGENVANYDNPEFNRLFEMMKNMENTPERFAIIQEMVDIARRDAPWLWGFHPQQFVLHHQWYFNVKPNLMAHNAMKYQRIDPELRANARRTWNQPVVWPVVALMVILLVSLVPAVVTYRRKEHRPALERNSTTG